MTEVDTLNDTHPSAGEIAERLRQRARELYLYGRRRLPSFYRKQVRWHAAFMGELSLVPSFCAALAETDVNPADTTDDNRRRLRPLIDEYQLPTRKPLSLEAWFGTLCTTRTNLSRALPIVPKPGDLEVQIFDQPSIWRDKSFNVKPQPVPPIERTLLPMPWTLELGSLRRVVERRCRATAETVLRRVRTSGSPALLKIRLLLSDWDSRLETGPIDLETLWGDASPARSDVVLKSWTFPVPLSDDRALEVITTGICDELEARFGLRSGQGRPGQPQKVARWWRKFAIDGKSLGEIAVDDVRRSISDPGSSEDADPNAVDEFEDRYEMTALRIHRALNRIGTLVPDKKTASDAT